MRHHLCLFIFFIFNQTFTSDLSANKVAVKSSKQVVSKQHETVALYPGKKPEVCFTEFTAAEKKRGLINVVIDTYQASLLSPTSENSLWDHEFLKQNMNYKIALDEYLKDKRGHKIKVLDLHHKTAEEIHKILVQEGFKHKRVPQMVHKVIIKDRGHYWLRTGEMTTDPEHPDLVIMDIYVHADGSMVRVKPESTPDFKRRTSLRFPHYSKSVLLDIKDVCNDKNVCVKDSSYNNEAFKLTREGNPLPKNIRTESGFRFLYPKNNKRKRSMQADVIMNLINFNLPTACLRKADWLDQPEEKENDENISDSSIKNKEKMINTPAPAKETAIASKSVAKTKTSLKKKKNKIS